MQTYEYRSLQAIKEDFHNVFPTYVKGKIFSLRTKSMDTEIHLNSTQLESLYKTILALWPLITSPVTIQVWG